MKEADYLSMQLTLFDECECLRGGRQPRFFVWENVPGAFSSNKGLDFRAVLEEIGQTEIPMPANDKWAENGVAQLPGCEIAWRVLDAVAWVPQRRKRIFLVADFGPGKPCAKEILFVEPSVCGNFEKGESERKEVAGSVTDGPGTPIVLRMRGGCDGGGKGALLSENRSLTLAANTNDQTVFQGKECLTPWDVQSNRIQSADGVAAPLYSGDGQGTHNGAVLVPQTVYPLEGNGARESHRGPGYSESDKMFTLNTVERHAVAYCIVGNMVDREPRTMNGIGVKEEKSFALNTVDRHAVAYDAYQHHNWREADSPNRQEIITYDIKQTVKVRKHKVDVDGLKVLLKESLANSGVSKKQIAEQLGVPQTQVDHYFRQDSYFSVPDPEVWPMLKNILGIVTDKFDEQIMDYIEKECNFDSANRIYDVGGVSPAITSVDTDKKILQPICYENHAQDYRLKETKVVPTLGVNPTRNPTLVMESIPNEPTVLESNQNHATVTDNGVCPTLSASMGMGGGYVPMVTESIPNEVMSTTGGAERLRNRERTDGTVKVAGQSGNTELYARSDCYHAETCGGKQTVGSLCAHDGRGFNGQDVANDKLIIEHYETDNDS